MLKSHKNQGDINHLSSKHTPTQVFVKGGVWANSDMLKCYYGSQPNEIEKLTKSLKWNFKSQSLKSQQYPGSTGQSYSAEEAIGGIFLA